jgi:hypothetical protein
VLQAQEIEAVEEQVAVGGANHYGDFERLIPRAARLYTVMRKRAGIGPGATT